MSGKLTAEQVHDAIFNGSSYASFDGAKYYADGIHMQEIADELNATLGHSLNDPSMSDTLSERGTCRLPETRIDHGSIQYNGTTSWRLCSACGAEVLADPANFCPNCGRKVE